MYRLSATKAKMNKVLPHDKSLSVSEIPDPSKDLATTTSILHRILLEVAHMLSGILRYKPYHYVNYTVNDYLFVCSSAHPSPHLTGYGPCPLVICEICDLSVKTSVNYLRQTTNKNDHHNLILHRCPVPVRGTPHSHTHFLIFC